MSVFSPFVGVFVGSGVIVGFVIHYIIFPPIF